MTDAQIFQLLGITFVPMGLAWIFNPKGFRDMLKDFSNRGVLLLSGMLAIIMGYLIVTFHNTWSSNTAAIITIIGWVSLLKGLVIIFIASTKENISLILKLVKHYLTIMPWLVLIVGLVAFYLGYIA